MIGDHDDDDDDDDENKVCSLSKALSRGCGLLASDVQ